MNSPARILIAEDHGVVRDTMCAAFEKHGSEFEMVGEADNGLEAIQKTKKLNPDLVLLDIRMPNSNGTEVLEELKKRFPDTKVIVFTQYQSEHYVRAAIAAGANGYFVKNERMANLIDAMRTVLKGNVYLSPRICHYVVDGYLSESAQVLDKPSWESLASRERMIIQLIAEGKKNREIADSLSLSVRSVETYRADLLKKLHLDNTTALIRYAFEHEIV